MFSAYAVNLSIDAKALYSLITGDGDGKQFQVMTERSSFGKPDHSAGLDHIGKLCMYSMYLVAVVTGAIGMDEELTAAARAIPGYDERRHSAARTGLAASHVHVHSENPETPARNMADVDELITDYTEYFQTPEGRFILILTTAGMGVT